MIRRPVFSAASIVIARRYFHLPDQRVEVDEFRNFRLVVDECIGIEPGSLFDKGLVKFSRWVVAREVSQTRSLRRRAIQPVMTVVSAPEADPENAANAGTYAKFIFAVFLFL